jgi:hypothetical protein
VIKTCLFRDQAVNIDAHRITHAVNALITFDGIYNDAPSVVADSNGKCDKKDLEAMGMASNIRKLGGVLLIRRFGSNVF